MKNESAYARKFASFFKKLPPAGEPPPPRDATTVLIVAYLQWEATRKQAEAAFKRIMTVMVDNNDLRVSHPRQVAELAGAGYPRIDERLARLKDAMQEIYVREHAILPNSLAEKSKKDIRTYFDTLPGMTPYVSACVLLLAYGAHCVPVDQKLADLLKAQRVVDPDATAEQIEGFLERQIKAGDAVDAHLRLQAWADDMQKKPAAPAKAPRAKPSRSKSPDPPKTSRSAAAKRKAPARPARKPAKAAAAKSGKSRKK